MPIEAQLRWIVIARLAHLFAVRQGEPDEWPVELDKNLLEESFWVCGVFPSRLLLFATVRTQTFQLYATECHFNQVYCGVEESLEVFSGLDCAERASIDQIVRAVMSAVSEKVRWCFKQGRLASIAALSFWFHFLACCSTPTRSASAPITIATRFASKQPQRGARARSGAGGGRFWWNQTRSR
jgi:hypothetical protein